MLSELNSTFTPVNLRGDWQEMFGEGGTLSPFSSSFFAVYKDSLKGTEVFLFLLPLSFVEIHTLEDCCKERLCCKTLFIPPSQSPDSGKAVALGWLWAMLLSAQPGLMTRFTKPSSKNLTGDQYLLSAVEVSVSPVLAELYHTALGTRGAQLKSREILLSLTRCLTEPGRSGPCQAFWVVEVFY